MSTIHYRRHALAPLRGNATDGGAIAWSGVLDRWAMVGTSGVQSSLDGLLWKGPLVSTLSPFTGVGDAACIGVPGGSGNGVLWSDVYGKFYAVGSGCHQLIYSTDGLSWQKAAVANNLWGTGVFNQGVSIATDGGETLVAVGTNDAAGHSVNAIYTSTDGTTWTGEGSPISSQVVSNRVVWANSINKFLYVAVPNTTSAITNTLATSVDGISWTLQGLAFGGTSAPTDIAWSDSLGIGVAVGGAVSTFPTIWSSTNGTTWTVRYTGVTPFSFSSDVVWASGQGLFYVGTDRNQVLTSPDGITWTDANPPAPNCRVFSLAYSVDQNMVSGIYDDGALNFSSMIFPARGNHVNMQWSTGGYQVPAK